LNAPLALAFSLALALALAFGLARRGFFRIPKQSQIITIENINRDWAFLVPLIIGAVQKEKGKEKEAVEGSGASSATASPAVGEKEEFRAYLKRSGIIDTLTKSTRCSAEAAALLPRCRVAPSLLTCPLP